PACPGPCCCTSGWDEAPSAAVADGSPGCGTWRRRARRIIMTSATPATPRPMIAPPATHHGDTLARATVVVVLVAIGALPLGAFSSASRFGSAALVVERTSDA